MLYQVGPPPMHHNTTHNTVFRVHLYLHTLSLSKNKTKTEFHLEKNRKIRTLEPHMTCTDVRTLYMSALKVHTQSATITAVAV